MGSWGALKLWRRGKRTRSEDQGLILKVIEDRERETRTPLTLEGSERLLRDRVLEEQRSLNEFLIERKRKSE